MKMLPRQNHRSHIHVRSLTRVHEEVDVCVDRRRCDLFCVSFLVNCRTEEGESKSDWAKDALPLRRYRLSMVPSAC